MRSKMMITALAALLAVPPHARDARPAATGLAATGQAPEPAAVAVNGSRPLLPPTRLVLKGSYALPAQVAATSLEVFVAGRPVPTRVTAVLDEFTPGVRGGDRVGGP